MILLLPSSNLGKYSRVNLDLLISELKTIYKLAKIIIINLNTSKYFKTGGKNKNAKYFAT